MAKRRKQRQVKPQPRGRTVRHAVVDEMAKMPLLTALDVAGGMRENRRWLIVTRKSPAKRQE